MSELMGKSVLRDRKKEREREIYSFLPPHSTEKQYQNKLVSDSATDKIVLKKRANEQRKEAEKISFLAIFS